MEHALPLGAGARASEMAVADRAMSSFAETAVIICLRIRSMQHGNHENGDRCWV